MFEFFKGKLFFSDTNTAVVDVNGVGYKLGISFNTSLALPKINEDIFLFAYYHITENSQGLYGFISKEEREIFLKLIDISGVGPKVALGVLSGMTVEQIVNAVENEDASMFKSVSGVGKKTAERLILELRGKLSGISIQTAIKPKSHKSSPLAKSSRDDAFAGLIALGYTENQVRNILAKLDEIMDEDIPAHEWITAALREI
ncbi:MAG: Holliday junction branch migration protein RuvA [Chitinispirillales bacterium]|jgi:Holliday junction DNA helicase RuvA|nr:Holliday junction branch migration protein RuvA [Chitinispirillales bacterium]